MKLIKAALSERFPQPLGMLTYMLEKVEALQKREGLRLRLPGRRCAH